MKLYKNDFLLKEQQIAPHLTLTKLKNELDAEICIKEVNELRNNFLMKYLAICEDGEFGTCTKVIKKYKI